MAEHEWAGEAREHFERGYEAQMAGRLDEAVECYQRSLAIQPTAEAQTFLGWALANQGGYEAAIRECQRAIALDPDFGNPYNDIGSYLIQLGRDEEAIAWLERAKVAPRYEPRHFPYVNLATVYARRHQVQEAIRELQQALAIEPRHAQARRELHRLVGLLN